MLDIRRYYYTYINLCLILGIVEGRSVGSLLVLFDKILVDDNDGSMLGFDDVRRLGSDDGI